MSYKNAKHILSVSSRILMALAFLYGQTAWAGQNQGPRNKPDASGKAQTQQAQATASRVAPAKAQLAEEEEAAPPSEVNENSHRGGQHEGIKVHGHWTIEVRNQDGTVVTHREYENSLQPTGAGFLALLLARQSGGPMWNVVLSGNFFTSISVQNVYQIAEPGFYGPGYTAQQDFSPTLGVTTVGNALVLGGTALASQSGNVTSLYTAVGPCVAAIAPSVGCLHSNLYALASNTIQFTSFTPGSPIPVSAGQTVAVTVNISFS